MYHFANASRAVDIFTEYHNVPSMSMSYSHPPVIRTTLSLTPNKFATWKELMVVYVKIGRSLVEFRCRMVLVSTLSVTRVSCCRYAQGGFEFHVWVIQVISW